MTRVICIALVCFRDRLRLQQRVNRVGCKTADGLLRGTGRANQVLDHPVVRAPLHALIGVLDVHFDEI